MPSFTSIQSCECSECDGTGWVTVKTERYPRGAMMECRCRVFHRKMAKMESLLGKSMLGKEFQRRSFSTFNPEAGTLEAYNRALDYARRFEDFAKEGRGLIFMGATGVGKTHLVNAILQDVICKKLIPGATVFVPNLLYKIRATYGHRHRQEENGHKTRLRRSPQAGPSSTTEEIMEMIFQVELLVMDDLGAEKPSLWVMEMLTMIINERSWNHRPTLVTSNLDLTDLEKQVGERTVSRLLEKNKAVLMTGEDYRKRIGKNLA